MIDGFVKNSELLEENSKVMDLLDSNIFCEKFTKKINSIYGASIIALIGPFGSGKSTMLHQIMTSYLNNELWVEFEAWKYPDRKDLWEGFVLDFIKIANPKELQKATKKIDGKQNDDKKTLIKTLSRIPGLAVLEGLNHFLETSPAKRVNDIQEIFNKHIENLHKNIFVVIEDIDRSGDAGIFFLETLKQFLRSIKFDKKLVVIVPIANENYYKNIDSYLKCVDYFDFFELDKINLTKFVDEIFDHNLFKGQLNRPGDNKLIWSGANRRSQVISFLEGLFYKMPGVNMRLLKLIVRKSNLVYKNQIEDGYDPDFGVTLCLEASKYFKANGGTSDSYFDDFKKRGVVTRGNVFCSYLATILFNEYSIFLTSGIDSREELRSSKYDFKFIERVDNKKDTHPSYPWSYGHFENDSGFGIASFYSKY
ncbi:MAG: hypothetical protein EOM84_01090 [Sphingobacteriia bacterium]|nr:hypothetical protein [Sphingobacteriia bacterium]